MRYSPPEKVLCHQPFFAGLASSSRGVVSGTSSSPSDQTGAAGAFAMLGPSVGVVSISSGTGPKRSALDGEIGLMMLGSGMFLVAPAAAAPAAAALAAGLAAFAVRALTVLGMLGNRWRAFRQRRHGAFALRLCGQGQAFRMGGFGMLRFRTR